VKAVSTFLTMKSGRTIGLALGSGSARGWSHIGVIRALAEAGIDPDIVCGTSIGALVGAFFVNGHLDAFESWIRRLNRIDFLRYLDFRLVTGGGFVQGKRLMDFFRDYIGNVNIEDLSKPFATVATDLTTGREIWFEQGPLMDAVRASIALPGIFTPVKLGDQWLVDGGLVNPIPVSTCRAMGAKVVIAVNLNGDIVGRRLNQSRPSKQIGRHHTFEARLFDRVSVALKERAASLIPQLLDPAAETPGLLNVLASSINIMQDRITRSRMAGDPPDVMLNPRLSHLGLLEFYRAAEAIEEGRACVNRMLPTLKHVLGQKK
jgi:NTE family protein